MSQTLDLDKIIENLYESKLPEINDILLLIQLAKKYFYQENNLIELNGSFFVVGDIHGQFFDFLNIFKIAGDFANTNYLFLGDIVDRGANSVECILFLLSIKLKYPKNIFLLRGNHETEELTTIYGFKEECDSKLPLIIYLEICDLFNYLPLCAIINKSYFCVHGGIIPEITNIKEINQIYRLEENKLNNFLWSDPSDENGYKKNPRGAGYLFGPDQVDKFLQSNNLKMIVRSHQLVMEGYKYSFNEKLVTIWSAPNYCYKTENIASVMIIKDNFKHEFILFDNVKNQK